jgi:flagellar protein FliJ
MTTPAIDSLLTLLELERNERDQALRGVRDAESLAQHAQAQAQTLTAYRTEYVERWATRLRTQSSIELVQCYQGFMQRLDQAIGQQHAASEQAHARLRQAVQALREREQRLGSVEKLIERRRREQHHHAARREQTITDEAAMRLHERRLAAARRQDTGGNDTVT